MATIVTPRQMESFATILYGEVYNLLAHVVYRMVASDFPYIPDAAWDRMVARDTIVAYPDGEGGHSEFVMCSALQPYTGLPAYHALGKALTNNPYYARGIVTNWSRMYLDPQLPFVPDLIKHHKETVDKTAHYGEKLSYVRDYLFEARRNGVSLEHVWSSDTQTAFALRMLTGKRELPGYFRAIFGLITSRNRTASNLGLPEDLDTSAKVDQLLGELAVLDAALPSLDYLRRVGYTLPVRPQQFI